MRNKKLLKKMLSLSLIIFGLIFVPETYFSPKVVPIAHAEIQTYIGSGEYIGSDDDPP